MRNSFCSSSLKYTAMAILTIALPAKATNLVTNGNFQQNTGGGQLGYNTTATGWTTSGYNFLFTSATQSTSGVTGSAGALSLYGPGNGYANGLINSPDGGSFIAADGAYGVGAITQSISGLTALQNYQVSFYWGGAQQYNFGCTSTPCTTEQWQVSLGGQTQATSIVNTGNSKGGFSGWIYTTMTFTATSSSELLSFLAVGTPSGEPPFSLLDGVSLVATPEPGSLTLLAGGALLALSRVARKRLNK